MSEVTSILERAEHGDSQAAAELLPLVYDDLGKLAAARMANEGAGHTLQPTALVHEGRLRLAGSGTEHWNSRGHFFGAAAEAMRRMGPHQINGLLASCRHKRNSKNPGRHPLALAGAQWN